MRPRLPKAALVAAASIAPRRRSTAPLLTVVKFKPCVAGPRIANDCKVVTGSCRALVGQDGVELVVSICVK